jgi:hypothetical protein
MSEDWTKKVGDIIAQDISNLHLPFVASVVRDDFNSSSGDIFVYLKMHGSTMPFGRSRMVTRYFFDDEIGFRKPDDKILKVISAKINGVLKKHRGIASIGFYDSPKKTYQGGEFNGYTTDKIQIEYHSVGWSPEEVAKTQQPISKGENRRIGDY